MQKQIFDKVKTQYKEHFSEMSLRSVVVDYGVGDNAKSLIEGLDIGKSFLVVSDFATHEVLGNKIEKAMSGYKIKSVILPNGVEPNKQNVDKVIAEAGHVDAIIAVGSGTINDICKYAGYLENKPYVVFGTAPSMNGYSSANASITIDGHKKTLKAQLPLAVLLDIDVLVSAPERLIRSGLGDSLCRSTARTDWLLSNLLLDTYYNEIPFDMLLENEAILLENSDILMQGDKEIMKILADTLILSGLGMYMCGGSYPASQGEHMIAHTMEMVFWHKIPATYHGEQIGVTTLTMAKLQEKLLSSGISAFNNTYDKAEIMGFFGQEIGNQCLDEYQKKANALRNIGNMDDILKNKWANFVNNAKRNIISCSKIEISLKKAGCATSCKELGWDDELYNNAVKYAKYSRERLTFLDFIKL